MRCANCGEPVDEAVVTGPPECLGCQRSDAAEYANRAAHARACAATDEPLLQFFTHAHLPARLAAVSKPFCELAMGISVALPPNSQRDRALEKLLEAKDCAVRAFLFRGKEG